MSPARLVVASDDPAQVDPPPSPVVTSISTVELSPPLAVVRVVGDFDMCATVVVVELVSALAARGCSKVSLDVGGVTTIDPDALDTLALASLRFDLVLTVGSLSTLTRSRLIFEMARRTAATRPRLTHP